MNFSELEKIVNDGKAKFKAFEKADEALTQLKALGQYQTETEKRIKDLLSEEDSLVKAVTNQRNLLDKAKSDTDAEIDRAKEKSDSIIAQAKSEANALLGKAILDADKQKQDAFKAKAAADLHVAAKMKEAEDWEAKANAAKAAHDAYKAVLAGG